MDVVIFGATGMVGQGVLRECLRDPNIGRVITVGRTAPPMADLKLHPLIVPDLFDLSAVGAELTKLDACFYCIGVTSLGVSEAEYTRVTHDLTIAVASFLLARKPGLAFVFVSGGGADSSEKGRVMWARVKGKTENALLRLPFKRAYMFRPGLIQPMYGIRSKTKSYRVFYALAAPIFPILKRLLPGTMTTTERLGQAMLAAAKHGAPQTILDTAAINRLSATIAPA